MISRVALSRAAAESGLNRTAAIIIQQAANPAFNPNTLIAGPDGLSDPNNQGAASNADNNRVTQLRGKQIDVAASPPWPQLDMLNNTPGLRAGVYALARLDTLELNTKKPPFTDQRIRHAVSLVLNRAGMVKVSLAGRGKPATSFLAPSVPYYSAVAQPTGAAALAQAKQLMSQAGSPHATIDLLVTSGDAVANVVGQVIQQNLAQIGAAVASVAYQNGLAVGPPPNDLIGFVQSQMYDPNY